MHRRWSLLRVIADTSDVFWIQSIKHPVFQHRKLNGALLFHQVFVSVLRNVQKSKNQNPKLIYWKWNKHLEVAFAKTKRNNSKMMIVGFLSLLVSESVTGNDVE